MSGMKRLYTDFTLAVEDYTMFIRDAVDRHDFDGMLRDVDALRREIVRVKEMS